MSEQIIIRRGLRLGDLEAETDVELLTECFIDNGELDLLTDVTRPESIILGRTGAGKSAMLLKIQETVENRKILDPNDISIRFLEYSDVVQFFESIGVNLDLFYKLLWRHILTVELLKVRYKLDNEEKSQGLLSRLQELVDRDPVKKEALAYFREWGDKFWLETEEQLKEVVDKVTTNLQASIGAPLNGVTISSEGAKTLSQEKKSEIVNKANRFVSRIQIQKLSRILELLEDKVFDDKQKQYYILIDRLDENWANTNTRYRFIRALIEEIKTFRKIKNIKILIALRKDLLNIVINETRDSGFQEDKNESSFLELVWQKDDLQQLIEKRVSEVYKRQYTKEDIHFDDIFPKPRKGGGSTAIDYILERTLLRPRDVLQFANECFSAALNSPRIGWKTISKAESSYSEKRLNSLIEEWKGLYPALSETIEVLRGKPMTISRTSISESMNSVVERLMDYPDDPCGKTVIEYCNSKGNVSDSDLVATIISCLYKIGAIGVKISTKEPFKWSNYNHSSLSKAEVLRINQIKIHKMLHKTLGIKDNSKFKT